MKIVTSGDENRYLRWRKSSAEVMIQKLWRMVHNRHLRWRNSSRAKNRHLRWRTKNRHLRWWKLSLAKNRHVPKIVNRHLRWQKSSPEVTKIVTWGDENRHPRLQNCSPLILKFSLPLLSLFMFQKGWGFFWKKEGTRIPPPPQEKGSSSLFCFVLFQQS